jgi:hypothetical protein
MEGLGRWDDGYDMAARGAGSTAIGVIDPFGTSTINPALIAWAKLPQGYAGLVRQDRWIRTPSASVTDHRGDGHVLGLRAVVPGPGVLHWGIGYRDLTDASYRSQFLLNRDRPDMYHRTLSGSGGLGELSATVAAPLQDRFAIGLSVGFASGTIRDVTQDRYESSDFAGTRTTLRTRLQGGHVWALGAQARVLPDLALGAVYRGGNRLHMKSLTTTSTGSSWEESASIDLPDGYGLGMSVLAGPRNRFSADWSWLDWESAGFTGPPGARASSFTNLKNTQKLGIGYTRLPGETTARDPLARRSLWKLGFTWGQLPYLQSNGATVTEWAGTLGVGFPVQVDRGFVNLVLEAGRTGNLKDVGLRETFVRLGLGFNFGRFPSAF